MNAALTTAEQVRLDAQLRPGEQLLWAGRGVAVPEVKPAGLRGFLARFCRKAPESGNAVLYAITAKRVLALPEQGEAQEWFLMLGLVQEVHENPDGSGDIVFDYEEIAGMKQARGIIGVPAVAQVRNLLADAIDAAYHASPWSV